MSIFSRLFRINQKCSFCLKQLLFFLFVSLSYAAQGTSQIQFDHLTKKDGFTVSAVYSIVEDHNGFIWIGGEGGLTRFDGFEFKVFRHSKKDPTSISSNFSRCLLVDTDGNIWIGTENGLNKYDPNTDEFSLVDFNMLESEKFKAQKIRSLYQDKNNIIWIGSYAGLTQYDPNTKSVTTYPFSTIRVIKSLDEHSLLVGTLGHGLYRFDIATNLFIELNAVTEPKSDSSPSPISLRDISIIDIFKTTDSSFLVGTWGHGIYKLSHDTKNLIKLNIELPSLYISKIHQEENGVYWIANSKGLSSYDNRFKRLLAITAPNSHTSTKDIEYPVRDIYETSNKSLWIATYGNGVYHINPVSKQFEYFTSIIDKDNEILLFENIYLINETLPGKVLIGGFNGDLFQFDHKTKLVKPYTLLKNGSILKDRPDVAIQLSKEELLLQKETDLFRLNYNLSTQDISKSKQFSFLRDFRIIRPLKRTSEILAINKKNNKLQVLSLNESGDLYVKTKTDIELINQFTNYIFLEQGKFLLSEQGGNIKILQLSIDGKHSIRTIWQPGGSVMSNFVVNKEGDIIVSTFEDGIFVLKKNKLSFDYEAKLIAPIKNVFSLLIENNENNIWAGTDSGLAKINLDSNLIYFFDHSDGLQEGEFNNNALLLASDDSMYFAGEKGLNHFDPKIVKPDITRLPVNLTNFYLSNKTVKPNPGQQTVLFKSISNTNKMSLHYSQNNFGIEFSAMLIPTMQEKLEYAYLLEGYENTWNHVNYKKRFASYTNIPHGEYAFHVKVKNKNGLWSEQDRVLRISISAPWWKTNLAYFIYSLLIVASIYLTIAFRTRILTKRSEQLAKQVKKRTKEVELLLESKNREFANVSHEFRTPLTLILGPLAQVIENLKTDNIDKSIKSLGLVQRNGYRLLRMVDQLLNIESFQVNSITQKQPIAFGVTTRVIAAAFREKAKENYIEFTATEIVDINFDFTPDAFEKILLNLLSNAFKYTTSGGQITISTKVVKDKELQVTVSDNGIGIALEEQKTIYNRFSRSINSKQENIQGAGIGLSLVKNLVEIHQGRIELKSELNIGSCFDVYLPIINPVSDREVKKHTDQELIALELMSIACRASFSATKNGETDPNQEHKNRILVIEDNDDMREFIAHSIGQSYQVLTACDGEQGVSIATEEVPDLIISDIMMPKLDGYQVTSQLRSQTTTNHIPIILLTAKNDRISRLKGWHENADEYLTKPFDVDELNIRIKSLLDIRDILKKRYSGKVSIIEQKDENQSITDGQHVQTKFINSLNRVIQKSYTNPQLKVSDIASEMAVSERQLLRKMKASMDLTPTEYLRNYRIEKSKILLSAGKNVATTAYEVGFSSQSHFSRCFKAYVGCAPTEFGV